MIKFFLSPFTWLVLLMLFGIILYLLRKRSTAVKVFFGAAILFFVITTPWLPDLMIDSVENQYPRQFNLSMVDTSASYDILVLGSGHSYDTSLPAKDQLNPSALSRLTEGVRIWRMMPKSRLILSGYSPDFPPSQAEVLAASAISLGVDPKRVYVQTKPTITYEEAKEYKRLFADSTHKLIIVTSAYHIPRAVVLFRSQGLDVIPASTFHLHKRSLHAKVQWLPEIDNLEKMEKATTEWVGMAYTKWWLLNDEEKKNVARLSKR